jgi:acyl-CoA dehydrogenase
MERPWPEDAIDFEAAVHGSILRAGGVNLARRCEDDTALREREVRPLLAKLGLFELDTRASAAEAAAAARGLRAAGRFVCPWPLVQQLAVPSTVHGDIGAVYLSAGSMRRAEHLDLVDHAVVFDVLKGETATLRRAGPRSRMPLDPFGVPCDVIRATRLDVASAFGTYIVLTAFWVVGALGHARDLAAQYARERRQFGRPIADFGAIQWHLSDIAVAHDGLWELASDGLARMIDERLTRVDALALYFTTLESAQIVLSRAHQVMGAIGLCEEHDLTVLNRHLQPTLRRPLGAIRVLSLLADEIAGSGFENLYGVSPATSVWNQIAVSAA